MFQKGFTLIELLVVVAIIGVLSSVGFVAYKGLVKESKENVVMEQCSKFKNYMMATFTSCASNPSSSIALSIQGRPGEIHNRSCNRSVNPTHRMIVYIVGHFNNSHKNVYGQVGGHIAPVMTGEGVCRGGGGDCNSFDLLEENGQPLMNLGRTYIQAQDDGHIAVTCFYDPGERSAGGNGVITEALQWTTPERFEDPR